MSGLSYLERKLAGICTRPGCTTPAVDDGQLCEPHRQEARARVRRSLKKRRRALRRAAKPCCVDCGRASKQRRCLACRTKQSIDRMTGDPVRENKRENNDEIAARTWKDADNRTRYHGQDSRGRQSNEALDEQDARYAVEAIAKWEKALVRARAPEHAALPKAERRAAVHAALAQIALASRFLDEILDRNKYAASPAGRDPDE